jgi:hypothetical protein
MQSKQLLLLQHLQILNPVYHQTAVTNPMMKAAYSPTKGGKPAKIANDNDSGIMVMATVKPAKISFYNLLLSEVK